MQRVYLHLMSFIGGLTGQSFHAFYKDSAMKRQRGRSRRSGGGQGFNPNRHFESNGPDVKIKGTAQQVYEKYVQYARDAQTSGDRVSSEAFLQHAEHYARIMALAPAKPKPNREDGRDSQPDRRDRRSDSMSRSDNRRPPRDSVNGDARRRPDRNEPMFSQNEFPNDSMRVIESSRENRGRRPSRPRPQFPRTENPD